MLIRLRVKNKQYGSYTLNWLASQLLSAERKFTQLRGHKKQGMAWALSQGAEISRTQKTNTQKTTGELGRYWGGERTGHFSCCFPQAPKLLVTAMIKTSKTYQFDSMRSNREFPAVHRNEKGEIQLSWKTLTLKVPLECSSNARMPTEQSVFHL